MGVWQTPAGETERAVGAALDAGYRHVDPAAAYVYVVTKLWNSEQGYDTTLRAFDAYEAWSPLGQGSLPSNATVTAIADAHGKTPAQVLIRWHVQLGNIVNPKSVNPDRIASNFDVFDFELAEQDMTSIASLDDGTRLGPDPRTFDFTG